jgi:hypothetical protein
MHRPLDQTTPTHQQGSVRGGRGEGEGGGKHLSDAVLEDLIAVDDVIIILIIITIIVHTSTGIALFTNFSCFGLVIDLGWGWGWG